MPRYASISARCVPDRCRIVSLDNVELFILKPLYTTEFKSRLPGTGTKDCRELTKYRVICDIYKKILRRY